MTRNLRLQVDTMNINTHTRQSMADVEDQLQLDFAIWQSTATSCAWDCLGGGTNLAQQAWLKLGDKRSAVTIGIGELKWILTPPSSYVGYCESTNQGWLVVTDSTFKVELISPSASHCVELCPSSKELDKLGFKDIIGLPSTSIDPVHQTHGQIVNGELSSLLGNLFISQDFATSAPAKLRRTISQKKQAEILTENLGVPLQNCITSLCKAREIADVFDAMVTFSGHYLAYKQVMQQTIEDPNFEDNFYAEQMMEEDQMDRSNKESIAWLRQQVRHAAVACQLAAESVSEAARAGASILHEMYQAHIAINNQAEGAFLSFVAKLNCPSLGEPDPENDAEDDAEDSDAENVEKEFDDLSMEDNGVSEILTRQVSLGSELISEDLIPGCSDQGRKEEQSIHPQPDITDIAAPDTLQDELDDDYWNIVNRAKIVLPGSQSLGSRWEVDMGGKTGSESSWENVTSQNLEMNGGDGADVLGSQFSEAESLDIMLKDLDPFANHQCSQLVNEFLNLQMSSEALSCSTESASLDEACAQDKPRTKSLSRWSSISSTVSSTLSDRNLLTPASNMDKFATVQLGTLLEEPACDERITSISRLSIQRAVSDGNVLQWCSCKFNKDRGSIEMRFQVGSFMEDDIATASIGISLTVPLRIEIFLDLTNVQHNLIEGKVRISTDQGLSPGPGVNIIYPESGEPVVSKPVVGLSCFIPHLVRRYLRSGHIHELWRAKYKFSEGELLTGLMKHVVKALVVLKHTCCVCGEQHSSSKRGLPVVPMPCEKNLCQALFATWLAVAPLKRLQESELHDWLMKSFDQGSDIETTVLTALIKSYGEIKFGRFPISYKDKILHLANKLVKNEVQGSWLELTVPVLEPENDGEEDSENTSDDSRKRKASVHGERTESPYKKDSWPQQERKRPPTFQTLDDINAPFQTDSPDSAKYWRKGVSSKPSHDLTKYWRKGASSELPNNLDPFSGKSWKQGASKWTELSDRDPLQAVDIKTYSDMSFEDIFDAEVQGWPESSSSERLQEEVVWDMPQENYEELPTVQRNAKRPLSRFRRSLRAQEGQDSSENESEPGTVLRGSSSKSGSNDLDLEFGGISIKEENMVDTMTRMPSERSPTVPKIQKTHRRGLFFTSSAPWKIPPRYIYPENDEEETATSASTSRLTGHAKDKNKGN